MNKTAIKNFAIWARNKLIADITYKAGLLGITEKDIKNPLAQSTQTVQFFDIGIKDPSSITGKEIEQRKKLVEEIQRKANQSNYSTAYKNVIEEVAYTWFNRSIAIRFMEVNDYLPTRIRVLSSESNGKSEPDLVTHAIEASLDYSAYEKDRIMQLKHENKLDELFRMLFIKQCNALNANLPELFEKTSDYTELLLNVSFTDKDGVVCHLVNDISEDDFNVSKEGQVEIIGWLYQYYNTEPKDEAFALLKKNVKISKERIPAATQLFTPDWIVRYMVENSLGRLWLEGHPNNELKSNWKYYLDEAEQEDDVQKQLDKIREDFKAIKPEDIKVIDPAMGSGHILVYAFDVLMQIYERYGYSQRDAAKSIVENNLYGLDIDNRAYQLAYFAVMMKARQHNRRILNGETICHVYAIQESNDINRNQLEYFGAGLTNMERNTALLQIQGLLDSFVDAKEYGSILNVENYNWELLRNFIKVIDADGQISLDSIGIEHTKDQMYQLVKIGEVMGKNYDVVATNPPYMGNGGMSTKLSEHVKKYYPNSKSDLSTVFMEKAIMLCQPSGFISMINIPVWMFLSSYENLRGIIIEKNTITNMLHFGRGIFGSDFGTTSFVISKAKISNYESVYRKLYDSQGSVDHISIKERWFFEGKGKYSAKQENYLLIPGKPIAYSLGTNLLKAYEEKNIVSSIADVKQGLATGDNNRFLRLWHEVQHDSIKFDANNSLEAEQSKKKWFPYNKGGSYRKWYGNIVYVVNWEFNGIDIKNNKDEDGKQRSRPQNLQYFFKDCLTWSKVTIGGFSLRYVPSGTIFDVAGCSLFPHDHAKYNTILGNLNSCVQKHVLSIFSQSVNYEVGHIAALPIVQSSEFNEKIDELVKDNINMSKKDWDSNELSWDFIKHPFIRNTINMQEAFLQWQFECEARFKQLKANEEELNRLFNTIYGLQNELSIEVDDKNITVAKADLNRDIRSFISYAVGCIFGRYSLNQEGLVFAGGEWDDSKYSNFAPDKDNILPITDEEYFVDDLVGLFIDFAQKVFGEKNIENNLDFIANSLGNQGNDSREVLRSYFINDFFNDHCSLFSVTGSGKRPIYWLFDSGKQNGFKALVYMHRYDENTIGNLRIDYLHRMQRIYENEIGRMQDSIENSKDVREVTVATKRKEKLIKQLQETKEYDEKIAHLALARISIDLDDGVKVNYEKIQTDTDGRKLDVLAKI